MATEPNERSLGASLLLVLASCAVTPAARDASTPPSPPPTGVRVQAPEAAAEQAATLGESSDLAACFAWAQAHAGSLRAAQERWQAAESAIELEGGLPDPRLTYGEFLEEVQTRTGPQERRLGLMQGFPWPGTLGARKDAARHTAQARRHEHAAARLALEERVAFGWYDLAFHAKNVRITTDVLALLRRLEPVVQSRIQSGGRQEDLLRLQLEIGELENDLASLEDLRPALVARLAAAMNHPAAALDVRPELFEPEVARLDADELLATARIHNPALLVLNEELAGSDTARRLAKLATRPDLALGVDWIQTGSALAPGTDGSGDDPLAVSLSLSLPIWGQKNGARRRGADHARRAARARLDDAEAGLEAQIADRIFAVDDAARRIALVRDSLLPRATEAFELSVVSYRAGKAPLYELVDAERRRLELEKAYWRACRDHHQSRARLRTVVGGDLE